MYLTRRSSVGVTGFEPWSARTATQLGPGRPHFAPHTRNVTKVIQSNDSQLGKPVNRLLRPGFALRRHRFKAQIGVLGEGVGARRGPELLIKMATVQLRRRLWDEAAPAPPMATHCREQRTEASRQSPHGPATASRINQTRALAGTWSVSRGSLGNNSSGVPGTVCGVSWNGSPCPPSPREADPE